MSRESKKLYQRKALCCLPLGWCLSIFWFMHSNEVKMLFYACNSLKSTGCSQLMKINRPPLVIYNFFLSRLLTESLTSKSSRYGSFRKKNRFSLAIMPSTKKKSDEDAESTWVINLISKICGTKGKMKHEIFSKKARIKLKIKR